MKWVLSFSVALLSVWKEVRIDFNTVALFLLWFVHFGGMRTWFSGEYCLRSTSRIVQWSQRCVQVVWGWSKMQVANTGESVQTLFKVWLITRELVIQTWKQKERSQQKIQSFNKASCDTYIWIWTYECLLSPPNEMKAAIGGNLLSLWTFTGWL